MWSSVAYCPNTQGKVVFLVSLVRWLCSDQISFHPPTIQKSIIDSKLVVSPSMSGLICVGQICGGLNRVILHCIPQEDNAYAWHDAKADAEANTNIEGTRKDVVLLQGKIPVPPRELVLCGSWALPQYNWCLTVILEPMVCGVHASQPSQLWVKWFMLFWQRIRHAFQLTFIWGSTGNASFLWGIRVGSSLGNLPP